MEKQNQLIGGVPVAGTQELNAKESIEVLNSFIRDCRNAIRNKKKLRVTVNADASMSQLVFVSDGITLSFIAS